jgi:hypothetical protein
MNIFNFFQSLKRDIISYAINSVLACRTDKKYSGIFHLNILSK